MTELRKAAEMALEALHNIDQSNNDDAIEALRQALNSTKFLPEEMDAYERGFIEGRQDQMRSTVERAVNAMTKREWVGLSDEDLEPMCDDWKIVFGGYVHDFAKAIETKLREKNHG